MDDMMNPQNGDAQNTAVQSDEQSDAQSDNPEVQQLTDRGNAAAGQGDYEGAAEAFEQAVAISPDDARAL